MNAYDDSSPSASRRLWLTLLVSLLAVAAPALAFSIAANAALPGHLGAGEFTKFEIDGDYAGANDWAGGGYGPYTTDQGRPSTGLVALNEQVDFCAEAGDDQYTGSIAGTPFPWPTTTTGNVNNKNDICEYGTALEIVDVDGEFHYVLYGYATRPADATGDQSLVFVLDKADTQVGDVIIEYDFNPAGGSSARQATWDGSSWPITTLSQGVQSAAGPNPFEAGAVQPLTFVEFAIDLTANGLFPPEDGNGVEQCVTFSSGGYATYTGNDIQSQLKDRAAGAGIPVSNCTDFVVEKEANVDAPGVEFLYVVNQLDGETAHDDTLVAPAGESDLVDGTDQFGTTIEIGESQLWQNVTSEPDYQIDEVVPPGWDLVQIECTYYDIFTQSTVTEVVTDASGILDQFQIPPPDFDNGVTTTCVITNETSGVIVTKAGIGNPDSDFSIDVTGAPDTPYTLSLLESTELLTFDPDTEVTITETLPGESPSWDYLGASCQVGEDGAITNFGPNDPVVFDTVGGEVITCVLTNRQNGQIEVVKTGEPVGGGDSFGFDTNYADNTVDPDGNEDFSLEIDDPADSSGDLAPGVYTIVELLDAANVTADPDYTLGDVSCEITTAGSGGSTSVTASGDPTAVVTLAAGDIVTCTYVNVQAGRLIVEKETDGLDDTFTFSGEVAGDITTTGGATAPGDELVVDLPPADDYEVGEVVPAGWDLTGATCDNGSGVFSDGNVEGGLSEISVDAGEIVTCTFTNERETAELTLTKSWGDTAVDGDAVDLTATGDDVQSAGPATGDSTVGGDTNDAVLTVYPGEVVTLEEVFGDNDAAYDTLLACEPVDAGTLDYTDGDTTGTFTVPDDDPVDVTCTFTNERQAAELTLEKVWVNGADGDTAEITASGSDTDTTTATAPDGASVTIDVLSGEEIDLVEVLGNNTGTYTTELTCTDADGLDYTPGDLDGNYTVPLVPVDVTCTFTNTRTETTLTLDKAWIVPADGDSVDLSITGDAGEGTGTVAGDGSTDEPATLTVYSGEVVDLAEVFNPGNADWYSTILSCDVGDLTYTADALTGTLEITDTPAGGISCLFSNTRETASVVVAKEVAPDGDAGVFDLSIDGNVEFADAGDGDASDPVAVLVGDPVTVSEAAGTDTDVANYDSTLACDNGVTVDPNNGTDGEFVVGTADVTVTCTFANTRKSAELTLTKDWVNGAAGDAVDFGAVGTSGNVPGATGDSVAPGTDRDGVLRIFAGESVTLSEVYAGDNVGTYMAELSCDQAGLTYTSGDLTGTYGVPSDPVDVTCTFVNTRTSAELTLQKEWIDGADGDTADLDITATLGSDPADGATATADGTIGSYNDGTEVTAEVLSGETVTLTEVLGAGNTGSYDSELSCDAAGLDPEPTTGTSGSYTMSTTPADVTCTFTNTRTRVNLIVEKAWVDAAADDVATIDFAGQVSSPSADTTASGATGVEFDTPVVSGEVLSGETVTITEVLDPDNAGTYASSLSCDGGDPFGITSGDFTVPTDATADITCRFVNAAGRGNIVIVKNVEGADGTFAFTGDWNDPLTDVEVGGFSITTEGGTGNVSWAGVLVPNDGSSYTVTEVDPTPDYDNTALTCTEVDGDDSSSADGLVGTIDLDPGETVICTYTNTQRSSITVIKDAVPDDDQAFTFTTNLDAPDDTFDLVDDGTGTNNAWTSGLVPAGGDYSVAETLVDGWDLTSATCSGVNNTPDDIVPEPGENVTCTFTNVAAPGEVVVTKTVEGVDDTYDWSFDIAIDPVDAGVTSPQTVSGTGNTSDSVTFAPLTLNETYTIQEPVLPAGWEQTSFQCTGIQDENPEADGYQVTITEPEQVIECDIVNTATPSGLFVSKSVAGIDDSLDWEFEFTLTPDGEPASQLVSGTGEGGSDAEWDNLVPGATYTIAETAVDGYTAGALTCTGVADQDDDPLSVTFVAPLNTSVGFEVICQITNTAIPASVIVGKTVEGVADDFDWSFDFTITPTPDGETSPKTASGTGEGTGFVEWFDLVPGETYTIAEIPVDGFETGTLVCTGVTDIDGADDESVTFVAPLGTEDGFEVVCSITNTATPSVVEVSKTVVGVADDFAWSFDFTITPVPGGETSPKTTSGSGDGSDSVTWGNLVPGQEYTIAEVTQDGFTAGEFQCIDVTDIDDDPTTVTFVAPLGDGDGVDVGCAVQNTAVPGEVTITKAAIGGDGTFTFAVSQDGGDPVEYQVATADGTGEVVIDDLLPGSTYTIDEVDPGSSWIQGDLSCTVTPLAGDPVEVDPVQGFAVEVGDVVACGITNTAKGTIVIVKNVEGADGTFEFTGDWTPDGSDVTFPVTTTGGAGDATFVDIDPGSYTASEVDPAPDYIAEAISCVDSTDGTASSVDGLTGTIELDPGEIVTCTFGNTETATVVVDKVTDPMDDPTAFDFQFGPLDGDATDFTLTDAAAPEVFGGLAPGDYLLDELVPEGWVLTDVTCSPEQFVDGTQTTITVGAGDTVTCTYTNSGRGDVLVDKAFTGVVDNRDGTQTVTYDLVLSTESAVDEDYEVSDELLFGDGVSVVSASVASVDGAVNADWDGQADLDVTDGPQTIAPATTATYQVEVIVELATVVTDEAADCELTEGEDGTGFLNEATVTTERNEDTDDDCGEVLRPDLVIDKFVSDGPTANADGTIDISYQLVVGNEGETSTSYDLVDEFLMADGTVVVSAAVANTDPGDIVTNADFDGVADTTVATDVPLAVGDSHTYTVDVTVDVTGVTGGDGVRDCELEPAESGTGLLNVAIATDSQGPVSDDACEEIPAADLQVVKDGPSTIHLSPGQTTAPLDYIVTVTNLGPGTAVDAVLVDTLPDNLGQATVATTVGTCEVVDVVITCDLGDLAADVQVVVSVSTSVTARTATTITNTATVSSGTPDPNPDNNRDEVTTHIVRELPRTGLELPWMALLAALLLLAGVSLRDLGRRSRRGGLA